MLMKSKSQWPARAASLGQGFSGDGASRRAGGLAISRVDANGSGATSAACVDGTDASAIRPARREAPTVTASERRPAESGTTDVAVFIDWENLRFSLWERKLVPNLSLLSGAVDAFGAW